MMPVRTLCTRCGVGCGVVARVMSDSDAEERAVQIDGDTRHPANRGQLCAKGMVMGEAASLTGRLLYPEAGGKRLSWDKALTLVAKRLSDTIARHGPDSIAFHVSGQMLTEDHYVANKLIKGFIGSANIALDGDRRIATGQQHAFGEDVVPATYDDLDKADLFLLIGIDMASSHSVLFRRIRATCEVRGAKLIVIDPRDSESSADADLHLTIRPGSEVALMNGMLAMARRAGIVDDAFLTASVTVPHGFWEGLEAGNDIWSTARACAIAPADLQRLFDLFAANPRCITLFSDELAGADAVSAILNLHLATGRIGKPGAAPFPMAGQPNAMGGREVGALSTSLAAHMNIAPPDIARVERLWGAPNIVTQAAPDDLARRIAEGRIKAVWTMGPCEAGPLRDALAASPLVIRSDSVADPNGTAHIQLPTPGWGEANGTMTNADRLISRLRPLFPPAGEAKPHWWIMTRVAQRMGWGAAFYFAHPADVYREHARLTAYQNDGARLLDLRRHAAISNPAYDEMTPWRWGGAPFTDGHFPTEDGKARLVPVKAGD